MAKQLLIILLFLSKRLIHLSWRSTQLCRIKIVSGCFSTVTQNLFLYGFPYMIPTYDRDLSQKQRASCLPIMLLSTSHREVRDQLSDQSSFC